MKKIDFTINWDKALEAVHYLTSIRPGITQFYLGKIMYYAEKEHLLDWGRPICGDRYMAMEHGPVPSAIRDIISGNDDLPQEILEQFRSKVDIRKSGNKHYMSAKEPYACVHLSETDKDYIRASAEQYGSMSFGQLSKLSHEKAWIEAWENTTGKAGRMLFENMIPDDFPDRQDFIEEIQEKARDGCL